MSARKHRLFASASYDREGITRALERMSARGWMLENMGTYFWTYRRCEPVRAEFACVWLSGDAGDREEYRALAAHDGWEFVCGPLRPADFHEPPGAPRPARERPGRGAGADTPDDGAREHNIAYHRPGPRVHGADGLRRYGLAARFPRRLPGAVLRGRPRRRGCCSARCSSRPGPYGSRGRGNGPGGAPCLPPDGRRRSCAPGSPCSRPLPLCTSPAPGFTAASG